METPNPYGRDAPGSRQHVRSTPRQVPAMRWSYQTSVRSRRRFSQVTSTTPDSSAPRRAEKGKPPRHYTHSAGSFSARLVVVFVLRPLDLLRGRLFPFLVVVHRVVLVVVFVAHTLSALHPPALGAAIVVRVRLRLGPILLCVLVRGLVVHDEGVVGEVEAIGPRLVRVVDHILDQALVQARHGVHRLPFVCGARDAEAEREVIALHELVPEVVPLDHPEVVDFPSTDTKDETKVGERD
mmetsp:Transcript_37296/g.116623  ORF Transcript_37296/g.116623 Transcript_37296/m.116623 type:complete len:239 (+) Transcript_37296:215-931(+)